MRSLLGRLFVVATVGAAAFFWFSQFNRCGVAHAEEYFEAGPILKICAATGYADAQAHLGFLYLAASKSKRTGEGFNLEPVGTALDARERGIELLFRAAKNGGSGIAENEIGLAYLEGAFGFEQSYEKALSWFEKGLKKGDVLSPYNIARIYAFGFGVTPDLEKSVLYLEVSATRGYCSAGEVLSAFKNSQALNKVEELQALIESDYFYLCQNESLKERVLTFAQLQYQKAKKTIRLNYERVTLDAQLKKDRAETLAPTASACSVYDDFLEHVNDERTFLNPVTVSMRNLSYFNEQDAPAIFYAYPEPKEEAEIMDSIAAQEELIDKIEHDTSSYIGAVVTEDIFNLTDCIFASEHEIEFWAGSHDLLVQEVSGKQNPSTDEKEFLTIWDFSPVGISANEEYAVFYAQFYCGGLCASGDYYLMKKGLNGKWQVYGIHPVWVS